MSTDNKAAMTLAQSVFEAWAPADSKWSAWAKPVLFMDTRIGAEDQQTAELPQVDTLARVRDAAIVVDLVGKASVLTGLALAQFGFQPVPLWNAGGAAGELVDMRRIAMELGPGAGLLRKLRRRENAMPVFLMNADRMEGSGLHNTPGRYDNRWAVTPQDLPSAEFLKANGLQRVVLVSDTVRHDLSHVLYRWQEAGLQIRRTGNGMDAPMPVEVARPSKFREWGYRFAVFAGLRRNSAGGFGAVVPDPSASGGGVGYG